ncbi:hypothetical protein ACTUVN_002360 [Pseudomonas caspiana]
MKDEFTSALSDFVQHKVEIESGIAALRDEADQSDEATQAADETRDRLAGLNAQATAIANELARRVVSER